MNEHIQQARNIYNINEWSDGFFDINEKGNICAFPNGNKNLPGIELVELIKAIEKAGLGLPVLVRFTDILKQRLQALTRAFANAIEENNYHAPYTPVYPIKVNQQCHVVEEILQHGQPRVGLESGSKSELIAILALSRKPGALIICNGYKDREYIRLALIGQRLGHEVYIILEKLSELDIVLTEAQKLNLTPKLGIRARLSTTGNGKWQDTGGEKSKFGFSAAQILHIVEKLREYKQLEVLQVLHFHLGSQIANIMDIQRAMRECARFYVELRKLEIPIHTVDVGGGLAVDYEGSHSRSDCSKNYSIQEYANNIVYTLKEVCEENSLPHPQIVTESGRALTAHHAVLITNVIGIEPAVNLEILTAPSLEDSQIVKEMWDSYNNLTPRTAMECYHDVCHWMTEVHGLYNHGVIDLAERARAEQIYLATCTKIKDLLSHSVRSHREVLDELNDKLADKYFCNFSLFQSLPDVWAIDQIFPIIPLSGLDQPTTRRGIIQDITCDSDGRIEYYVDTQGIETTLPLLTYDPNKPYLLGIFMVGAYQEILGDMHNLFGDTDSVHIEMQTDGGYKLVQPMRGDTVEDALQYVGFNTKELIQSFRNQISDADLSRQEAQDYLQELMAGLYGYTYLED